MGQTTGAVKTARLSQFLQEVFRADTDLHTLRVAALTLGRLVKAGGPVTAEVVDSEVLPSALNIYLSPKEFHFPLTYLSLPVLGLG